MRSVTIGYLLFLFYGFIMILGFLGLAFMHEQVHVEIYKGYGIDSRVEYFRDFPHMATYGDKPCPTEECNLAHNINEVVGYQLQMLYILVGFGILTILSLMQLKLKTQEK